MKLFADERARRLGDIRWEKYTWTSSNVIKILKVEQEIIQSLKAKIGKNKIYQNKRIKYQPK